MTMVLEMPAEGFEVSTFAGPAQESEGEVTALKLLTGDDKTGDEQADEEVTIVLVGDVADPVVGFEATKGQTFTASIDEDGSTYIPWGDAADGRVYLEAEEFEVVQSIAGTSIAGTSTELTDTEPEPTPPASEPMADSTPGDQQVSIILAESDAGAEAMEVPPSPQWAVGKLSARAKYLRDRSALEEQIAWLSVEEAEHKEAAKDCKKEREVLTKRLVDLRDGWERDGDPDDRPKPVASDCGGALQADGTGTGPQYPEQPDLPAVTPQPPATAPVVDAQQAQRDEMAEQARYQRVLEQAEITELSLAPKVTERIIEAGATTIWKLEQLRKDISLGREKWPKGIGAAKVTDIEDALMRWMARNQETWASEKREKSSHPKPRTAEQIEASNRALEEKQEGNPITIDDL